jgi:hypothetical protein
MSVHRRKADLADSMIGAEWVLLLVRHEGDIKKLRGLLEDLNGFRRGLQVVSLRFNGRLIGRSSGNVAIRRNDHGQIRKTLFRRTINGEGNFPHFDPPLLCAKHITACGRSAIVRQPTLLSN